MPKAVPLICSYGQAATGGTARPRAEEVGNSSWTWRRDPLKGAAVVFDLDGVLADAAARQHYLKGPGPTGRPSSRLRVMTPSSTRSPLCSACCRVSWR